ncbi:heavy metal-associated isoprenylated plant protein 16-like [Trifolium pratense]|uniref:heavy metal-associated isoprenylated plant protein 16-like n=1 Tax=Trifolium pratense TaxID=57577 RepID=UPI001E696878|nr:heavy metal-associated isoprenylated plant protein 16-like [Trifolium pratense]
MAKQKIVIKVSIMDNPKFRSKAMKIAVGISGVESAAIGGDNKDQIEVIGEVDPYKLAKQLRKRFCRAELVSVGPVEKKEEKKKEEAVVPCSCPLPYYGYPPPPPPPIPMCVTYPCQEPSPCSIM